MADPTSVKYGPVRWWLPVIGAAVTCSLVTAGFATTVQSATADAAQKALTAAGLDGVEVTGGVYRDVALRGPLADEAAALAAVDGLELSYDVTYDSDATDGDGKDGATEPTPEATPEVAPSPSPEPEPEPEPEPTLVRPDLSAVQFSNNSAVLDGGSKAALDSAAVDLLVFLEQSPSSRIEIQGHTDSSGPADSNRDLSQRRANAVKNYLVDQGVPASALDAVGYGEAAPIADNGTAAGKATNRRVVFEILEG